ncbi:MAG: hypothetical protein NT093_04275 [Candidatus Moranbacteria bacterium]|nr:hypothetical protein [Candidatus Moranbacteria bacterium]
MSNEEFENLPDLLPMQCPECRQEIKPQYTDRYLEERREHKLQNISLMNYELQCPLCKAIFPCSPIKFTPMSASMSEVEIIWEKTKGWFKKFLP